MPRSTTRPVSKAKTAYGLLGEIPKLILQEPKRYDQTCVLEVAPKDGRHNPSNYPPCGTVGCVAGWTVALTEPPRRVNRLILKANVMVHAARILGLTIGQAEELFAAGQAGIHPQTLGHAKRGARHIARFRKRYAKQLRAKRIRP